MAIASIIVQPAVGCLEQVAAELSQISGVTIHTTTPKQELIVLLEAPDLISVSNLAKEIAAAQDILGVYPTYVNNEV